MARHKNDQSRRITDAEKAQILKLWYQDKIQDTKEICRLMGIENGQQVIGIVKAASNLGENAVKAAEDIVRKYEPKPETGNPLVDPIVVTQNPQTPQRSTFLQNAQVSIQSPTTVSQGLRKPNEGWIAVWREEVDGVKYIGTIPYPYKVRDLGERCGDGSYILQVWHPNSTAPEHGRETISGQGAPRYPRLTGDAAMMMPQQPTVPLVMAPKEPSPMEKATAGLMDAVTKKVLDPPAPVQSSLEKLGEKLVSDAVTGGGANPRAMTLDDWIRAQQAMQQSHDKRMEEIRVEATAQAAKSKAEADAAVAKTKAEADAAISKMKADAEIRATQDKAHHDRMRELDKDDRERRDADMKKALKDASDTVENAEERIKGELTKERARDKELNDARFEVLKGNADTLTKVANIQADLIRAQANKGDDWTNALRELKPTIDKAIDAVQARSVLENNPNCVNNAINNPGSIPALTGQTQTPKAGAQNGQQEAAMENQVQSALGSPKFQQFMEEYCLEFECYTGDPANETCDGIFRTIAANMFNPGDPAGSVTWLNVAGFIRRRKWARMREVLYPKLSETQKTLLERPEHETFYETFRAKIFLALKTDTRTWEQNVIGAEEMRKPSETAKPEETPVRAPSA